MAEGKSNLESFVGMSKDVVSLSRDAIILLVFVLLLLSPATINGVLVAAGFTEGSIAGFTWKKEIEAAEEKSKDAGQAFSKLEAQLLEFKEELKEVGQKTDDPEAKSAIVELDKKVESAQRNAQSANEAVKSSLLTQQQIIQQVSPTAAPKAAGWIYLGKVQEDKTRWISGHPATVAPIEADLKPPTLLKIQYDTYLRGDADSGTRSASTVSGVLKAGEMVEVVEVDYSHMKRGGWAVWAKVRGAKRS